MKGLNCGTKLLRTWRKLPDPRSRNHSINEPFKNGTGFSLESLRKERKGEEKERKESGINPTMSELDVLVEELVEREQTEKHQRENDGKLQ